jgi:hypothetical protein
VSAGGSDEVDLRAGVGVALHQQASLVEDREMLGARDAGQQADTELLLGYAQKTAQNQSS